MKCVMLKEKRYEMCDFLAVSSNSLIPFILYGNKMYGGILGPEAEKFKLLIAEGDIYIFKILFVTNRLTGSQRASLFQVCIYMI